jgi:acetyl-CoA carboxylase biotin carboxyl carrier protein
MPAKKPASPKSIAKTSQKAATRSAELTLIDNLAEILNSTGLSEIELEQKGVRVRVSRALVANYQQTPAMMATPAAAPVPAAAAAAPIAPADNAGAVKSPMVQILLQ